MCVLVRATVADEESAPAVRRISATQLTIDDEIEADSPLGMYGVE